jgi:threonine dehydratase
MPIHYDYPPGVTAIQPSRHVTDRSQAAYGRAEVERYLESNPCLMRGVPGGPSPKLGTVEFFPASQASARVNNASKVAAMEALGADVRLEGQDFDAVREACEAFVRASGARYVHSMNEPLLIAGVATAYLEALLAVPDADVVIIPIGGGSGACGAAIVARALHPATRVIGVQAAGAPAVYRSFYYGRLEATDAAATCAEGLATRMAFELPLRILRKHLDEIILIGDVDMRHAMRLLLETTHMVAEEAGAAATAAAKKLRAELDGRRVILPITGGNATASQLMEALRT